MTSSVKITKIIVSIGKFILYAISAIVGIFTFLLIFIGEPITIKELWFRLFYRDYWIKCDSNFISDDRHFTYIGKEIGTCSENLKPGEFIVGTVDSGFQESIFDGIASDRCAAFVLIGPIQKTFFMNIAGGGDYYYATNYDERYFVQKWDELDNHPTCNQSSRGYDIIKCDQSKECLILP